MAKGTRSNSQKKLRTQRREAVLKNTAWLETAEAKRMAALHACLNAEPVTKPSEAETTTAAAMDTAGASGNPAGSKYITKKKKLAMKRKGKKVTVLSGRNQFHKKKRKGAK